MFRPIDYDALGREFRPGKPLSTEIRRRVVGLYLSGEGPRAISRAVRVNHGGRRNPSKLSDNVIKSIELFKLMKPSMFGREIRERVLNDGGNLPALSMETRE